MHDVAVPRARVTCTHHSQVRTDWCIGCHKSPEGILYRTLMSEVNIFGAERSWQTSHGTPCGHPMSYVSIVVRLVSDHDLYPRINRADYLA